MYGDEGGYNLKFVSYDGIYEAVCNQQGILLTELEKYGTFSGLAVCTTLKKV